MDLGLEDKVVLVTGANNGMGLAISKAFLDEGAKVAGGDLSGEHLKDLEPADSIYPIIADLSTKEGTEKLVQECVDHFGKIDILVNNVGIANYKSSFLDLTDDDWNRTLQTNLYAMIRTSRAALPHLKKQSHSAIISIGSESGHVPDEFAIDYSVSKAGVINLTSALAHEFGNDGIRVNCVSPGPTRTNMWEQPGGMIDMLAEKFSMDGEDAVKHFAANVRQIPRGEIGKPDEIAQTVLFLASEKASYVNGAEFAVNGGSVKYH
ncbi:MAG: SDR family oxidoreductase [Sporolactobacillus sp.]|uniref:SDR family NAD(P)-dependent oxidoreductase n=1 Tax=Sporolactobacillus sp. STSJ-5 TaxID=2965076 RepID=UPI002104CCD4|nr:SDR family oxidoreductase [Sporolactobacillus sp. STSJ-5]MCQ2008572.1 SDR family oxidoreductase [Sporolactobacillus sp. STSJ-5]